MKFSKDPQGSKEWLEDRKKRVTASDAAIINGTNKFRGNSPLKLYQKKFDILEEEKTNYAMEEGSRLEGEALKLFNKTYSASFIKPPGGYHDEHEWLMASLDGYDEASNYILEIKCGAATYEKALYGEVPPYYYDQIQHQLFVSDKKICYYMAYRPDKEPVIMEIPRDHAYFDILFEKEKEFYDCMVNLVPPTLGEKEFVEIMDASATETARAWSEAKEILKNAEKMEKLAREALKDETDGGNCIFPDAGVKVELRIKKGALDYGAIIEKYERIIDEYDMILLENEIITKEEMDLERPIVEKYRKPDSSWLQPIIIKQA